MYKLSSDAGLFGYGETSWENGNITEASTGKKFYQNLIRKANSIPLIMIFKHYHFNINDQNRKMVCPFSNHKNGRENSSSFYY